MQFHKLSLSLCAGALALAIGGFSAPVLAQGAGGSGAPRSTEQPTTQPNPSQPEPRRTTPAPDTTGAAPGMRSGGGATNPPASETGSGGGGAAGQGSGTQRPAGDPRANPEKPVMR
jgi:hypothetical protein